VALILDTGGAFSGLHVGEVGIQRIRRADPSLTGFVSTLTNWDNFPARRFALKAEMKDRTIRY
jgi:hypothetical protein